MEAPEESWDEGQAKVDDFPVAQFLHTTVRELTQSALRRLNARIKSDASLTELSAKTKLMVYDMAMWLMVQEMKHLRTTSRTATEGQQKDIVAAAMSELEDLGRLSNTVTAMGEVSVRRTELKRSEPAPPPPTSWDELGLQDPGLDDYQL